MKQEILMNLSPQYLWGEAFHYLEETDSTNVRLEQMAKEGAPHGTVLLADRQSAGRGRLGRSFLSKGGVGIYMSVLLRPNCTPMELMHLTCATGVYMCDAVEKAVGLRPQIKWTNDLVMGKRKLAGILTKLGLKPGGRVDWAIVGVGINCCQTLQDFPPELQATAGSLRMALQEPVDRAKVAAAMMEGFQKMDEDLLSRQAEILKQYRLDCITIGQDISLVRGEETRYGHALDVDEEGALVVRFPDGHLETVNSGEVSVRGMYGYV